jgi:hypothetical protein
VSAALIDQLKFNSRHDTFTQPQVQLFCLLHAINNVCGFNSSDHFTVDRLDAAATLLGSPVSTSTAFLGYTDSNLEIAMHSASDAGFPFKNGDGLIKLSLELPGVSQPLPA